MNNLPHKPLKKSLRGICYFPGKLNLIKSAPQTPKKKREWALQEHVGCIGFLWKSLQRDKGFSFFFFFFWVKTKSWTRIPSPGPPSLPKAMKLTDKGGLKSSQWGLPRPLAHPEMTSLKNKQHGERGLFLLIFLPQIPERHSLVSITSEPRHALCISDSVVSDSLWPHGL